jgi:very-short-patch-repair endonuclease
MGRHHRNFADKASIVSEMNSIHRNKYDYSETFYIRANKHLTIGCKVHGNFRIIPNNHLRGGGCPKCSSSKGETFVRAWLSNNGFVFEEQYAFSDFNKRMRYDFYIPSIPLIIEYDGEQHYKPVVRDGDVRSALLKFIQQKKTDAIKTKYLDSIGIPLLRIGYMDDIQETLSKRLLNAK